MSSVETRLRLALIADTGVFALLGDRLYVPKLPPRIATFPVCIIQRINTTSLTTQQQSDPSFEDAGWVRFQITNWSHGPTAVEEANTVAVAIQRALKAICLGSVQNGQGPNFLLNRTMVEQPATVPPLFGFRADYKMWYAEQ